MTGRSRPQKLAIWMNGFLVGHWSQVRGKDLLAYHEDWVNSESGRPLSLSLPFTPGNQPLGGDIVRFWFDNLLPDSDAIRNRLAFRHKARSVAAFDLLTAIGRDCVGAFQLLPPDEIPDSLFFITGQVLDEGAVADILRGVPGSKVLGHREEDFDLRLSIAGAQEKTALLRHQGQWMLPHASTPTTHIFKLPLGLVGAMQADMRTSVENEWLCAQLAAGWGLPVAPCEIVHFEDQKALIVTRFDRKLASDNTWIARLPQEDFCQATGTPGTKKYQSDGGPGISRIMEILGSSIEPQQDKELFFKSQILFWLLAATDGHAKNFSLFHLPGKRFRLTPLYDILSAHPVIGTGRNQIAPQKAKLAMPVKGSKYYYLIQQIRRRHWISHATQTGLTGKQAEAIMEELIQTTPAVIAAVANTLPKGFPENLAAAIFSGIHAQCAALNMGD